MDGKLTLSSYVLAYADVTQQNNPQLKTIDWKVAIESLAVANPKTEPFTVGPGETLTLFDGTRTTSIDNTTEFDLALVDTNRYRFTWSGTGVDPEFRTDRDLECTGHDISIAVNANQTVTMTSDTAGDFAAIVVGDIVFIPGPTTSDDATEFNTLNEGYWEVLSTDGDVEIQLARPNDVDFTASAETVTPTADIQLQAFTSSGVQVSDKVDISAGFASSVQKTYTILAVNPKWIEVSSTAALPVAATAVPGATGMVFYTQAKRWLRVMATQEAVVRYNGYTGDTNRISPWEVGDIRRPGWDEKCGSTWQCVVVNRSTVAMSVVLLSAE